MIRSSRIVAQVLTFSLATALSAGAMAQDGPSRPPAKKAAPKKAAPKKAAPKKPAGNKASKRRKRAATKRKPSQKATKAQRDAKDDSLFGGDQAVDQQAASDREKARRKPVSTEGAWPHEDTSPWPAERPFSSADEEELFGELDEDSPEDREHAEKRGSTRDRGRTPAHHGHPHHHGSKAPQSRSPVPSPDASDWRVRAGASTSTPRELAYIEGADVPEGYVKATRANKGLVIAGAVTLGVSWLATSAYATYLLDQRDPGYWQRDTDEDAAPETVLYIPLVGPWIALGTVENNRRERGAFIAGGVLQAGGLAMLIGGLAAKKTVLVKTPKAEIAVAPSAGPTGSQINVFGRF